MNIELNDKKFEYNSNNLSNKIILLTVGSIAICIDIIFQFFITSKSINFYLPNALEFYLLIILLILIIPVLLFFVTSIFLNSKIGTISLAGIFFVIFFMLLIGNNSFNFISKDGFAPDLALLIWSIVFLITHFIMSPKNNNSLSVEAVINADQYLSERTSDKENFENPNEQTLNFPLEKTTDSTIFTSEVFMGGSIDNSQLERLEKLHNLFVSGAITDQEFDQLKKNLLSNSSDNQKDQKSYSSQENNRVLHSELTKQKSFIGPINSIKNVFAKFASFTGRATREEYWYFILFKIFIIMIAVLLTEYVPTVSTIFFLVAFIGLLIPHISVATRRLHDIDRSGWWQLIGFIPLVGIIILIIMYCLPSSVGINRYDKK